MLRITQALTWIGLIAFLLGFCVYVHGAVIIDYVGDVTSQWSTNQKVTFTPLSTPQKINGVYYRSAPKWSYIGADGKFSNSIVAGWYDAQVGDQARDKTRIFVPTNAGPYTIADLSTNLPQDYFSTNTPYLRIKAGTNTAFTTNGLHEIVINTTGGTNSSGGTTGAITDDDSGEAITDDDP